MHNPQHDIIQATPASEREHYTACETCCPTPVYTVTPDDLPLACPTREMCVWQGHPRVYLAIEQTGSAQCPYCGTRYQLKAD